MAASASLYLSSDGGMLNTKEPQEIRLYFETCVSIPEKSDRADMSEYDKSDKTSVAILSGDI